MRVSTVYAQEKVTLDKKTISDKKRLTYQWVAFSFLLTNLTVRNELTVMGSYTR